MRLSRKIHTLCVAALAAALIACSSKKEDQLLNSVPATAPVITAVDLDRLLKMAGCDSEQGVITLSDHVRHLLNEYPGLLRIVETAAAHGDWIDLSNTVIFTLGTPPRIIFLAEPKEDAERRADSLILVAKDKVWISDTLVEKRMEAALTHAKAHPISADAVFERFLSSQSTLKAVWQFEKFENPWGDDLDHILLDLKVSDRLVTLKANCTLGMTPVDPFSDLQSIDSTAFLGMPARVVAAAAAGIKHDALKTLPHLIASMPMHQQLSLSMLSELLDDQGGTMAIAIAPGGNAETIRKFDLERWLMRAILPTGEKGEGAAQVINHFGSDIIYAEADSLYVRVWNYDPFVDDDPYYNPSTTLETPIGPNDRAALFVTIPYRSEVMKAMRLDRGYDLKAILSDSTMSITMRVLGPSNYILPALIQDVDKAKNKFHTK